MKLLRPKQYLILLVALALLLQSMSCIVLAETTPVTWNPNDKGPALTLSNGNLTANISNFQGGIVRATEGRSSGKWYWEVKFDSGTTILVGVASSAASLSGVLHADVNGRTYYSGSGNKYNGTSTSYGAGYTTGDIIGIALDMDNGTISFYKNGVAQGVAFSDLKSLGTVFPVLSTGSSLLGVATTNFGATPFKYSIPAGHLPYDSSESSTTPITAPVLQATSGVNKVQLEWSTSTEATSYNVKRSTIAGGPYTTIGSAITSTYIDATAVNGTTYYYVVTALNTQGESVNSNEVSATPQSTSNPPSNVIEGNRAILEIRMMSGEVKEYDMSAAEIEAFLNWYDNKENNVAGAKAYFAVKKNYNIKPFLNRWDYIVFSKIQDFEIKDYNE